MKSKVLLQLDTDPHPSVFDSVVAIDSGVDQVLRHGGVTPDAVPDLVRGLLFTRGGGDLASSAIFVGGSDVAASEDIIAAVRNTFFGPFQVSVLFDANGCNTTAASAVLAALTGMDKLGRSMEQATALVLGGTGPVGQRVARLLLGLGPGVAVRLGSRTHEKAAHACNAIARSGGRVPEPCATGSASELANALKGVDLVIAAGAAAVMLAPRAAWMESSATVLIDLNAVPPAGIEGVEIGDQGTSRDGRLCWGALGVGGKKMKIHKKAIETLFTSNGKIIDAEECLAIGRDI